MSASTPVNIRSNRLTANDNDSETQQSFTGTPIGTPDIRALRAQYAAAGTPPPNIPPRAGTPYTQSNSPGVSLVPPPGSSPRPGPSAVGGISAAKYGASGSSGNLVENPEVTDVEDVDDAEKLKVLRRHLVSKAERQNRFGEVPPDPQAGPSVNTPDSEHSYDSEETGGKIRREDTEPFPIPYHTPGADVTHDIYKWHSKQTRRSRANSALAAPSVPSDPVFEHIHEPGGFRRNYVLLRANEQGLEEPRVLVNNFIDFLFIFGHFAGEDLEDEEEAEEDEEEAIDGPLAGSSTRPDLGETAPLLGKSSSLNRSHSRSRRRASSMGPNGNATVTQAVLILLKGFVGTGILFLGKAFFNGGILFSSLLFVFIAAVSLYSFLLLVKTKFVISGSFGDMGGTLYGPWMRNLILSSIVVSQIGFVGAYIIFVAENLQALIMGITHCAKLVSIQYLILVQLIVFLPLAMVRDLAKLSTTALVADVFILAGLVYIFGSEISIVARQGPAKVELFNPKDFPLFVGTAVFSFEGIGLVIPITDAMREPRKFPAVLTGVMFGLTVLFGGAGALAYLTFGSEIQTVVLVNLNSESKMVQSVQFFYSLAILLSVPLQLFPAVRIMENGLFTRSGKVDTRVKWLKNAFRAGIVLLCALISWIGAADLDKFVAFIGCFACVPLCYVYPAMLHYRAVAHTRKEKLKDLAMIVFGLVAAAYTSIQTIRLMLEPSSGSPKFGNCEPPT
ncbi:vacuolar amino acid transporter 4 [Mycena floridula]|nr:vacuolar amino acid transporter 4 [Mycena floridula]